MERAILLDYLKLVQTHVALGAEHVERQRQRIARLCRDGHDTFDARQLLVSFEETQALHIEHRDRLLKELAYALEALED